MAQRAARRDEVSASLPTVAPTDLPTFDIDFEAGRFFERADTRGTLDQQEFQRLWRAARSGEPMQPSTRTVPRPPFEGRPEYHRSRSPPAPSELPLPAPFDAGARFERFDANRDGHLGRAEFEALLAEWQREAPSDFERQVGCSNAAEVGRLFAQFDSNHDGFLSRGDFLDLVATRAAKPTTAQVQESVSRGEGGLGPGGDGRGFGASFGAAAPNALSFTAPPNIQRGASPIRELHERPPGRAATHPAYNLASGWEGLSSRCVYFDETSGVPLTAEGAEGARGAGHRVVLLKEAYEARADKLREKLATSLMPKRAALNQLGHELGRCIDEVQAGRLAVERETVMDCEVTLERLRAAESVKLATLTQNANEVNSELEFIDRLSSHLEGSGEASTPAAMLGLIQTFPEMERSLERSAARKLPREAAPEEMADLARFPRETKKRVDALALAAKHEEALAVKDRLLWEVIQGHKSLEKELAEERALCGEYSEEMAAWLELTDRLKFELVQLRASASQSAGLEADLDDLVARRQDDAKELAKFRAQARAFEELLEENYALRQQLSATQLQLQANAAGNEQQGEGMAVGS